MNVRCHSSVSPRTSKRNDIGRVGSIISKVPSFEDRAPIPSPKQRSSSKKNKHTSSTAICNDTPGNAAHHSKKLTKHNKKMNRRQLGQIASHPLEMDTTKSHNDNLFKIARLQIGDGVWIKRSNFIWKYAVLKRREFITTTNKRKNEDDVCGCWLVFTVNERGCIKKIPIGKVGKWVKTLADDYDEMIRSSGSSRSDDSHDSCSKNDSSMQTKNISSKEKKVIEKKAKQKSFAKSSIKSCIRRRSDDRDIRRKEQRSVKFAQYIFADKHQHNISLQSEQDVDEYEEKEELIGGRISQNNTGREKHFMNKEQVNSESNNYDTIDGSDIMDANPYPTNEEKEELMKKRKCHLSIDGAIDSSNTFWDDDDENEMMLKGKPLVLEDHEVSMYALKSSEMVILQDHEVSMHALVGDESLSDDSSLENECDVDSKKYNGSNGRYGTHDGKIKDIMERSWSLSIRNDRMDEFKPAVTDLKKIQQKSPTRSRRLSLSSSLTSSSNDKSRRVAQRSRRLSIPTSFQRNGMEANGTGGTSKTKQSDRYLE